MKNPLCIAIAGGSASGKTTVATEIYEYFKKSQSVIIIRQDDYYKNQDHLPMEERIKTNYDHPNAFDNELMICQFKALKNGEAIEKPLYDFTNHTRKKETKVINPVDVIIMEGLFPLENQALRNLFDLKLFVDTDADIRLIRRLVRDVNERGRTLDSVITQYMTTVRPMHLQFVEPSKRFADVIIPEGGSNRVAIDLIITKIESFFNHKR